MQTVTPDNVCNIIHLTNRLSIPFPVFSHFLTAFSLYIPTSFLCIYLQILCLFFYEVHIQVENILYYV